MVHVVERADGVLLAFGALPRPTDPREAKYALRSTLPPRAVDIRQERILTNVQPVRNQGGIGACAAFSSELAACLARDQQLLTPSSAPLHQGWLYYHARKKQGWEQQDSGSYCVTPEHRVLTSNLQWVPAGDLREGDTLLAFEEYPSITHARRYQPAVVTRYERKRLPVFEIELDNGVTLRATGEHRWLGYGAGGTSRTGLQWIRTDTLATRRVPYELAQYFTPWGVVKDDYAVGYLAAAFDGEGSLDSYTRVGGAATARLSFTQNPNAMLKQVETLLTAGGFTYGKSGNKDNNCIQLRLTGGAQESLRLLGQYRPVRLLDRFYSWLGEGRFPELRTKSHPRVTAVRYVGEREIAAITSSSGTYFAEGFGAHNTADNLDILMQGAPLASVFPYVQSALWSPPAELEAQERHDYVLSHRPFYPAERNTVEAVWSALDAGMPVVAAGYWPEAWFSPVKGVLPGGIATVPLSWGHAYLIFGCVPGYFLAQNSWGEAWTPDAGQNPVIGERLRPGQFLIPWEYAENGQIWEYRAVALEPVPAPRTRIYMQMWTRGKDGWDITPLETDLPVDGAWVTVKTKREGEGEQIAIPFTRVGGPS